MGETERQAPGGPGVDARWTSSDKMGVGTTIEAASQVWFTIGRGILNEVYFPRVDLACTRDLGLVVADGRGYFSEEKRDARHEVATVADGVPAYRLTNTCRGGRYRIEKTVFCNPREHALIQETTFTPLAGELSDYHLYALLGARLGNRGSENTGWVGAYKGVPMLFAARGGNVLALACSAPWRKRSAGFVGSSDGWKDIKEHNVMEWEYDRAEGGTIALTGEVDLAACGGRFVLALGFGASADEAGHRARKCLVDRLEVVRDEYIRQWEDWLGTLHGFELPEGGGRDLSRTSAAVLRTHESKSIPGGIIASLSVPWGRYRGDDNLGGYHLVWPRDMVEAAGGLLAVGEEGAMLGRMLRYLQATQEDDGHWPQNMWVDGSSYWEGLQLDEMALPIMFLGLLIRENAPGAIDSANLWPMMRKAAAYIARNGPSTAQDRWEKDTGYTPFTLGTEIAALLVAADLAESLGEPPELARYLRETADAWNANIERWLYVTDTKLAKERGVEGYYARIVPPDAPEASSRDKGTIRVKNRPPGDDERPAAEIVSPDVLALVRFGLRAPDDPRILNTIQVIDATLRVETPTGPCWRRYTHDGYGEHEDGSPYDGTGVGRAWPLLTGERAHYELAAGRRDEAVRLLATMASFADDGGMLPEQVWDAPDIPDRDLYFGRASGSAMPLAWAHAEYLKLRRSLHDNRVFDTPAQTVHRYLRDRVGSKLAPWRFHRPRATMPAGSTLRVEVRAPAVVRWGVDGLSDPKQAPTRDTGLGLHYVDLATADLPPGRRVVFTFDWAETQRPEGRDFTVTVS
jgi:glucoamylase